MNRLRTVSTTRVNLHERIPMDFDRRRFLRGEFGNGVLLLFPPWAGAREVFEQHCTRCHDCVNACPEDIIRIAGSTPPRLFQRDIKGRVSVPFDFQKGY